MYSRLQLWMAFFAFFAVAAFGADAPAPANASASTAMPPGQIKAVKVVGNVTYVLNGQTTTLHDDDPVPQGATVNTLAKSRVILVFSNGATTQLGDETTLVIDEFLQDPFAQTVAVATLTAEPTTSHTHLDLKHGELLGNVKHLNKDQGSTFTIDTPVGAAGIRGTTFRIIFKPSGTGLAFAIFSVSTVEGNVVFQNTQMQQQQQQQQQGTSETRSRGGSVAVTTGQEVVVTVSVNTDPKTGQVVVTAPIQLATTTPLNPVVRASLVSQATDMATTVEQKGTTFTSTGTTSGGTSSGSTSSSSSTTSTDSTKKDDKTDSSSSDTSGGTSGGGTSSGGTSSDGTSSGGTSSGGTSSGSSSSGTTSTSSSSTSGGTSTGAASTLTSSIAGGQQINTKPGFTSTVNDLTPGAGS